MSAEHRNEYITRDTILRLLSDDEVARVCTEETAPLQDGEEYVDLEQPDRGVLYADSHSTATMEGALARKAVYTNTWRRIVALLYVHSILQPRSN